MTFVRAQEEFKIRHYLWAISEFEKEISNSFPNLRLFKPEYGWEVFQFMQVLEEKDRLKLAHALLKKWHSVAATALGETISVEEQALLGKCRLFSSALSMKLDDGIAARRLAGEKIRFASKRKLQKVVTAKFKEIFETQIIGETTDSKYDPFSLFSTKLCGWVITTQFWYGRHESLIQYNLGIESPTRIHHPHNPQITGPAMRLDQCISWLYFNKLKHLSDDEVDAGCDIILKCCRYCIEVLPKLLKGIEFENITEL